MIWDRLSVIASVFPHSARNEAVRMARRWGAAGAAEARLAEDLIRLGGVLTLQPVTLTDGFPETEPVPVEQLAYQAGRRDLALQLLALMGLTPFELNKLMKEDDRDYT
jgi:hypothetical protein